MLLPKFILNFLTFLLSIMLFLILPLGVPIVIILNYILRVSVDKLARRFSSKVLGKMVTTRGTIFAADNLFTKPKCNVLVVLTVEDNFEIQRVRKLFEKNVLKAKQRNGEIKYPELKQYLTKWGGYYFWAEDNRFNLNKHVKLHKAPKEDPSKDNYFTEEDIQELRQELINKKWLEKKPLWEFIVVNNYYPNCVSKEGQNEKPHTALMIRFHHSVGDGYAWLSLIINDFSQVKAFKNPKPDYIQRDFYSSLSYCLTFPFKTAFAMAELMLLFLQDFDWHVPNNKQTSQCFIDLSEQVPIKTIKDIKDHFDVSFCSVLFAVLAGVHREMLLKKGFKPPKFLPCIAPMPLPGHPGKLRNYLTGALIKLPTGEEDPVKRIKLCHKDYESIKRSTTPVFYSWFLMIGGSFLSWISKIVAKNHVIPTGLSIFPGGLEILYSDNGNQQHKCIDATYVVGLQVGNMGICFCVLSYGENIRFTPIVETYLISKEEAKYFTQSIHKQIDLLKQLTI